MRSITSSSFRARFFMILSAFVAISLLYVPIICASMVVAPSKIVVNSNTNTENYRKNNNDDNTVKAIIPYYLEEDEVVIEDPSGITMTISYDSGGDDEPTVSIVVDAISLRYCYIDDNLIIEFDREYIEGEVLDLSGTVDVVVDGTFYLEDQDEPKTVNETGAIFIYNPSAEK
ncbi:hypothetical protein DSCOOX_53740 [Desulfosarcina ovata subsp. ovata]|uniref:Uncharacterized protein n=2 Tax=Desulfosarcina ovata TaxID=83564 RepID=A0A5K8AKU3_9BACT|nr:hypothetical protein DSCOOX_53740 [Desulfosarcina ovata subsp. ovata]